MNKKSIKKKLLACVCLVAVLLAGCGGKSGSIGSLKDAIKGIEERELFVSYAAESNAKYFIVGNSILQVDYDEDKNAKVIIKLTYDERGNLVQRKSYRCNSEITYSSRFMQQYAYDDKDRLIEWKVVDEHSTYGTKYKYENDQISGWTEYSGETSDSESMDEGSTYEYKLSYNEKGQVESAVLDNVKRKLIYNEKGFLEKEENYDITDGTERIITERFFDGSGKYSYDSKVLKYVYYDSEGNVGNTVEYKYKSFYMKNGTITPKEEGQAAVITSSSITYEMDEGEPVATQS